jgi:pyruvate kinase
MIMDWSDGIVIAGNELVCDEIPAEKVPIAQKYMIEKANKAGKPVITAIQVFDSKTEEGARASASDVVNAVLDGSDCVMLSGDAATGAVVEMCAKACIEGEKTLEFRVNKSNKQEST